MGSGILASPCRRQRLGCFLLHWQVSGGIASIHALSSATPSVWTRLWPTGGIATLFSTVPARQGTIDWSEWPGTTSKPRPQVPPPADAGTLHTPQSVGLPVAGSVWSQSSQNAVPEARPTTP